MLRKQKLRFRRHKHIRKHVSGTAEVPRMAVFRSNRHIYVQLIDDSKGHTLASATSRMLDGEKNDVINLKVAEQVGEQIAGKAKDLNIDKVVFDRGGFKFHGKVKALADAARKSGLKF